MPALDLVRQVRALGTREEAEIARRFPKLLRRVGGYNIDTISPRGHNMAQMLVGSEGTLGFFTRLELDLQPLPPHKVLGICHFGALNDAMTATRHIVELAPTAVELPREGSFLPLDVDSESLPPDWYLRLAGEATKSLREDVPLSAERPIDP